MSASIWNPGEVTTTPMVLSVNGRTGDIVIVISDLSDSSSLGRSLLSATTSTEIITLLGLGSAALADNTAFAEAIHIHVVDDITGLDSTLVNLQSQIDGKQALLGYTPENLADKGIANGYTPLGPDSKVPSVYLPIDGTYLGTWNATTNTPTIISSTGNNGDFYLVAVAGTTTIDGTASWNIGDQVRFNGTIWEKIPSFSIISSVAGKTGVVILEAVDISDSTTAGRTLLTAANAAAQRTALALVPGTDVQVQDAGLQSIAGLTTAADRMIYTTAPDTYAVTPLSAFARTILDDGDSVTVRTTIGAHNATNITTGTLADARTAFLQSGTGAVVRSYQTKLRDVIYAADFGVVGDNFTDNTSALAAAITEAKITGKAVLLPTGIIRFTTLIDVTIPLIGQGFTAKTRDVFGSTTWNDATRFKGTVLFCTATSGIAIEIGDGSISPWFYGGLFSDFLLIGPGTGTGTGLYLNQVVSANFSNIGIANFSLAMNWNFVEDSGFYNVKFWGNQLGLQSIISGNNQNSFYQVEFNANATCIRATWGEQINFYGGLIQGTTVDGIILETTSAPQSTLRCWNFYDIWYEDNSSMLGDIIRIGGNEIYLIKFSGGRFVEVGNINLTGGTNNRAHVFRDLIFIGAKTITIPVDMARVVLNNIVNGIIVDNSTDAIIDALSGSFTATLNNVSGTVTGTIDYSITNRLVCLDISTIIGTSIDTSCSISGLPTNLIPQKNTGYIPIRVYNNSIIQFGLIRITTVGNLEFFADAAGSSFVAAGTKGVGISSIIYNLDT